MRNDWKCWHDYRIYIMNDQSNSWSTKSNPMKNAFTKNVQSCLHESTRLSSSLLLALFMILGFYAKADITNPSATSTNGYLPSGTTEIFVDVYFESNTLENADIIAFSVVSPMSGVSLSHGSTNSPSPYLGCGLDQGNEAMVSGTAWMRPMFPIGGSGCGAFRPGEVHTFPLQVTDNGANSGQVEIVVSIFGDGNGETNPSNVLTSIFIQPINCFVNCPSDIVAQAGVSGTAQVNVPAIQPSGQCNTIIQDFSGVYPIGVHEIEVVANSNPDVSCTFNIIVEDTSDPSIVGCSNITENLGGGDCGAVINPILRIADNSTAIPLAISQNNDNTDIDSGVSCPGGITRVFRVFDTNDWDIDTELDIESVDFGVLESAGGPEVTVTIWTVTGGFPGGTLTEVSSASLFVADGTEFIQNIPVSASIDAGEVFVVELSSQGSLFSGLTFGTNFEGESAPSYIQSDFCGFGLDTYTAAGFPNQSLVMTVNGEEDAVKLRQIDNTGYALGGEFPIGNYTLEFEATDASGNSSQCSFSVQVNGFNNPVGSITCNDVVNVSLDEDCVAIITPDQVLEGDQYACYDDYTVDITNAQGVSYGNMVSSSNIGMTLTVTVTGPNGNSCWGNIVIEDKGPAQLDCQDVYTTCTGSTEPGSPISDRVTFVADINQEISDDNVGSYTFDVPVFGLVGSTITDVDVVINIDHSSVSDLVGTISAPDGTTVQLFTNPGGNCDGDGLRITLDDEAMMTAADLNNVCEATIPAIQGAFQSEGNLSIYDGEDPNGTWQITISDTGINDGGIVEGLSIVFTQKGGSVVFPTTNATTFNRTGPNQFTVNGIDPCGPVTAVYADNAVDQPCSSPYSQIIRRSWFVEDAEGNTSQPCIQNIYVFRNDLSTLQFPPNYDGIQYPALSCSQFGDIIPDSTVTGYPSGDFCDNVQIFPYEDQIIDVCPKSYKIIRQWRILEWCSGDVIEHNQVIKVEDADGPVLECPADEITSAEPFECYANYVATKPTIIEECSPSVTYELSYLLPDFSGQPDPNGVFVSTNVVSGFGGQFIITELPFGTSTIRWRVFDECGNFSECKYNVTVEDQVSPVAVCDEFTTVSIGSGGEVWVDAFTFDDLSLDNCGIVEYAARRMDNPDCPGFDGTPFGPTVPFTCCDVNTTVMVEFRVMDAAGNTNSCMVEVSVQDKLPPYITECPADITIECQADYEDLALTGEPAFIDNCEVVAVSKADVVDIDQCGRGTVRRTWTVEDAQGLKASCVQIITLADSDPFDESDIRWPRDYTATTCDQNLDPENLPSGFDFPQVNDDVCSLVAIDYTDQKFTFVDGSCEKILRNWSVIDWCTYDPNGFYNEGIYRYTQIIKLENTIAPEFVEDCDFIEVCSYGDCGGAVTLTKNATDDCTPAEELNWTWEIDVNDDGSYNLSGTGNEANVNLNEGFHEIWWTVEDKCGNVTTCKQKFEVVDCKKPTPYCLGSVTTVVMPSSGTIAIWANDFNYGSTDNCTEQEDLIFSFSSNINETSRTFSCSDIPDGQSMYIPLEMWVTDEDGNQDYCVVGLILQDNIGDVCNEINTFTVNGTVAMADGTPLSYATVSLTSSIPEQNASQTTDANGNYAFTVMENLDYDIAVSKNDDVDRGISTLDLVLIQRHILTIAQFEDPYKIIAADIDNNERVSGADIVYLRKLILGVNNAFPNGQQSWRFVDAIDNMDVTDVFPFDEHVEISSMSGSMQDQDFVAVKIGDVNDSAKNGLNGNEEAEVRRANAMNIIIDEQRAIGGERVELPVYAQDMTSLLGYQFTLNYANQALDFAGYESGQVELSDENFALIDKGVLTTSWNDVNGLAINEDEPLFTFVFDVNQEVEVSRAIQITSEITDAEAYDAEQNIYDVVISSRTGTLDIFSVSQNTPNPFADQTMVTFYVPGDDFVNIEVRDLSGKLLMKDGGSYTKGTHTYSFDKNELNASGVLLYTLSTSSATITKRMVAIK